MQTKVCTKCGEEKPLGEFSPRRAQCRACHRASSTAWKQRNVTRVAKYQKEKRAARSSEEKQRSLDKMNKWAANNPDKVRAAQLRRGKRLGYAQQKAWKKANPAAVAAIEARRRAARLRAMPAWADPAAIRAVYTQAQRLSEMTGVSYHVDHVIPLKGKNVCGLHWEGNLEILLGEKNVSKGNTVPTDPRNFLACEVGLGGSI